MKTYALVFIYISASFLQPGATSFFQQSTTKKREVLKSPQGSSVDCTSSVVDYICSSNWAPRVLNEFATCGLREFHTNQASIDARRTCAVNGNGDFCESAFAQYDQDGMRLMDIQSNCSTVLDSSSGCPSDCRTLLEQFKAELGCCINTFINGTLYARSSPAAVDYRVWNSCNISLPADGCENGLIIENFARFHRCSDAEFYHRVYRQNLCQPNVGQPYVSFLLNNSSCYDLLTEAQDVVNSCSLSETGFPCELFSEREVDSLDSICEQSAVTGNCSMECRDRLVELNNSLGCCVNYYNRTVDSSPLGLSYSLWKSCGVESPGFCNSTLKLSVETAVKEGDAVTNATTSATLVGLCTIILTIIATVFRV